MPLSQIIIYVALLAAMLATCSRPFVGVVTYCVLDLVRPQNILWWAFGEASNLSLWIAAVTIISWLFHLFKNGKKFTWTLQNILMVFFLVAICFAHLFAQLKDPSLISLTRIAKMIFIFFVTVHILNSYKRIRWLILAIVFSIGYLAFRGNWQYFVLGWHGITEASFGRGVSLDNNGYATLFVMAFPVTYFLLFTEKSKYLKTVLAIVLVLLLHAILLTFSRGGFLGLAAVAIFCFLKTKKSFALILGTILFLIIGFRLAGPPVIERMTTIKTHEQDASAQGRKEAWKAGMKMMADHPLTGVGLDNFKYLAQYYNPEGVQSERVAHNAYIHIGAEAGIPSLIIYILLILSSIFDLGKLSKKFRHSKEKWKCYYPAMIEGSLLGYVVCGMFLTLAWFELFYPIIALAVALKIVTREQVKGNLTKKPNSRTVALARQTK